MTLQKYIVGNRFIPAGSIVLLVANLIFSSSLAADSNTLNYAFSGYGTLGYAFLNDENAEYRTGEGLDGATDTGSYKVDSRFALQLDASFNPRLSTSFQVIARQDENGEAGAEVEWGFLRVLPADTIEIRVGRMSLPAFSLSDSREVGFASVMLRPPEDVYSLIPLKRLNGADLTFESVVADSLLIVQLSGGYSREAIFNDLEPDANPIIGISTLIERGPFRARVNFTRSEMDIDSSNAAITGLRNGIDDAIGQAPQLEPLLRSVRNDVSGKRAGLTFVSFGLTAEFDRFFFDTEFAQRLSDNWVSDVNSWSIVGGGRFGKFSPYVFASAHQDAQDDRRITLPNSPGLAPLQAGIDRLYQPRSQNTVGAGLRFDFSQNIAFKSQVELISREEDGISFARNTDDGSDTGEDVVLMSFVMDFVF